MATNERRDHLLLVVHHILGVWNAWSANSDVRYITRNFEDAINDALLVFGDGSIPGDLRTLNARMDALREQWEAWNRKNESSGGKNPIPDNSFWKALESVEAACKAATQPIRRHLEAIGDLTAQKVTDPQICRMYGFTDTGMPDGVPELWKLQEERAAPGKHTGAGSGWIPPHERRRRSDEAKASEAVERIQRAREGKLRLIANVAPEPIEDLIRDGVSGKQICRMKKIEEADLAAYCDEKGLTQPLWQLAPANATQGLYDPTPEDEPAVVLSRAVDKPVLRRESPTPTEGSIIGDEPMTLEQEIIEYHKLGTMTPAEIAAAVSSEGNEISHQKVGKVIARWEKEPEAFETTEVG